MLDAGGTMGITTFPLGFALWRWWASLGLRGAGEGGEVFLLISIGGFIVVHIMARTAGWSDIVLVTNLVGQCAVEWGPLGAWKSRRHAYAWGGYVALMGVGVGVRLLDVKRKKIFGEWGQKVAWVGHGAWHIITGTAVAVLIWCGGDVEEEFCLVTAEAVAQPFNAESIVKRLGDGLKGGDWMLGFIPPYPLGHAQIEGHEPWGWGVVFGVLGGAVLLRGLRMGWKKVREGR
jgi:hypothetical protein